MAKIKRIDMSVGIYDSRAVITRHKSGGVSVRVPYVKWSGNTGTLCFEILHYECRDMGF